jgi:hypothetical protein
MEYARAARCLKILLQSLRHRSRVPATALAAFFYLFSAYLLRPYLAVKLAFLMLLALII